MKPNLLISICVLFLCGCSTFTQKPSLNNIYSDWFGREVLFPDVINFTQYGRDTVNFDTNTPLKIICYIDSTGCTKCKMQLYMWVSFIKDLSHLFTYSKSVSIVYNICSTDLKKISNLLIDEGFNYPVWIDLSNSLDNLNHFPADPRFHCFLLDENNKVILIGNPVQNPKIKELYLRTISERLGIDYNPSSSLDSSPEINLGTFSQSESKTAELLVPNNSQSIMQIDSVFTSCECTTASIDKSVINPSGSANLTVKYTPDGVGEFYREVYVQIKGEDKPLVYKIRGKVE